MDLPIYKDVPIRIRHKIWHRHKISGKRHRDFCNDYGDVPVFVISDKGNATPVYNARGLAYGARNRACYRKGYKRSKEKVINQDC